MLRRPADDDRPTRSRQVEITATDGYAHRVSDQDHAWGQRAGQGAFHTMCNQVVLAGSLASPPAPLCAACRAAS